VRITLTAEDLRPAVPAPPSPALIHAFTPSGA
jgi:hypothetical protein